MRTIPREVNFIDKASFVLSQNQKSVLVGTLLGDGGIRYRGNNCRLHIKHALKQLPLVNFKRNIFKNITTMEVSVFNQKVGEKDYSFAEFVTLTHPEFTKYYHLFYQSSKKIIPVEIHKMLVDPLGFAVWFMDDGAADYAGATLQTHCFSKIEVERLISVIKTNFEIDASIRMNKGKWIIYFPKTSMSKLSEILEKEMLDEFKYKLVPYSRRKS